MRLVIASDIHGAADRCAKLMEAIEEIQPDRVALLGDLLYHGPRNDLPADYAPKRVIQMLNSIAESIVAVRGNCEAEVDQMVLDFPCMATYNVLLDADARGGRGRSRPALGEGDALVYGHTHKKVLLEGGDAVAGHEGVTVFNPGSVGIPKDGSASFGVYEDGRFEHRRLG